MQVQQVYFQDLGALSYKEAWDYQEAILLQNVAAKTQRRQAEEAGLPVAGLPDTTHHFLFVEHPHVFTLGKSGHIENVLLSQESLKQKGIDFFRTNRGGDITYHGPGQIVGYPIIDLEKFYTDIGKYLRNLEEAIILTLAAYGLKGERSPGETGVWLDPFKKGQERKICAIGVRTSRWVTMHGFALNVNTNLDYFKYIIPCGIQNKQVTSLQKELGRELEPASVKENLKKNFEEVFNVRLV